ncbi:M20/M25/M40 family metallo-hydrolase [Sphingomonas jatrophae]|uniref:Acetylornithine deacetylase/Succinyl-diaminopimelate desuccinylase n=1 Tax=Sphingomonas jatrophae TaxID=1166337 RepID=A0A1I6M6D8_9SPHN|nr:M20/M25/M40 family metallo-hydrolase [Sphingomonas jatrophae]SFS11290.1 Acetylornithine deacetylase/Succinyl-diaminopimelate desuccinylase [Sphingomonas jatrophae]
MRQLAALLLTAATIAAPAAAQTRPDQQQFRALYKDLVETNTVVGKGSCTAAAQKAGAYLKAAGFTDAELTYFADADHPQDGGLVAVLPGRDKAAKAILLLGHLDVVEAKREDWTRDPFKLIEEDGFFYARGTADMKGLDAVWIDTLARLRKSGPAPKRTIKLALTCGEETTWAFNGAEWLAKNKPDLIAAEFALNEGGGGRLSRDGKPELLSMQVGEKTVQNYRLETTNPGGHSSRPVPDNAIYELAQALAKVQAYEFPVKFTDTTRAYFTTIGKQQGGALGAAIPKLIANPNDAAANKVISADATYHSMLRTTCVATLLEGGHANNALPQRAAANINCRIHPLDSVESTEAALIAAIADPKVKVTQVPPRRPAAVPPPLDPKVLGPAQTVAAKYWPGLTILPSMSIGGTDGIYLSAIGIPVYGVPGIMSEADSNGAHGLNERMRVESLYRGRDYLFDLVKAYAG